MKYVRLSVGLSVVVAGFLTFYIAFVLSSNPPYKEYVLPLLLLAIILLILGVWLINPYGIWGD
jgi:uncharacterized membrane protein HdeD (DUF308 family)